MTSNSRQILALDALRGIAAIAVLLIHVGWITGDQSLARFGYLAVDLFFVMSGFVVGRAYEHKLLAGMSWRRFMLIRIARLYPAMFLGVLAGVVAYFVLPAGDYRLGWHSIGHFLLIPDFSAEVMFPLNGVLWSLFYEIVINALHALVVRRLSLPILVLFVVSMGIARWLVVMDTGSWGGGVHGDSPLGGFTRIGWSYGLGLIFHRLAADRIRIPVIVPITLASLVLLLPNVGYLQVRIALSFFVLLPLAVALAIGSDVPRALRGVASWLGGISYPLYAIHLPLLFIAADRFDASSGPRRAVLTVLIVAIASVVELAFDAPIRRRLAAAIASRHAPITAEPATQGDAVS
jgi:peptidoglycan/LPS O-acetylase OafA/YrhL